MEDHVAALQMSKIETCTRKAADEAYDLVDCAVNRGDGILARLYHAWIRDVIQEEILCAETVSPFILSAMATKSCVVFLKDLVLSI